ncbi:MAG: hypothetical protein NTW19_21495 [Planctomycetota bacterium]|nr:hypothetical protein [Planctomycetota bacterium]
MPSFEPGCAASDFASGVRPHMLMGAADLPHIAAKCRDKSHWCAAVLNAMRINVAPLVDRVHESKDLHALVGNPNKTRNGGDPLGSQVTQQLDNIALVGLLDDDARALEAVRLVLTHRPENRGNNFNVVLAWDMLHGRLSPEDRAAFVGFARQQVDRCVELIGPGYRLSAGGNILMTFTLDALSLCLAVHGEPDTADFDARLPDLLLDYEAAIYCALGPEGYPAEDIGYGTLMLSRLLRIGTMLRRTGLFDPYVRIPRLKRFGRAMLHFVQPWGMFLSNTGDHGDDFGGRDHALAGLATINHDPTLTWLLATLSYPVLDHDQWHRLSPTFEADLGEGRRAPASAVCILGLADAPAPVHPRDAGVPTAFVDRDRGIVSLRSGWGDDDTYVYFDGSQRPTSAQGHAHDSAGHFCLSGAGEYFAVSPGRYGIDQDQHNVLLVDGKSGQTTDGQWRASWYQGRLTAYRPGALCDYAAADCSQQANCYWSYRHIGLVKGAGMPGYAWTVDDVNGTNDFREFWWTMYAAPGSVIETRERSAQVRGRQGKAVLAVHFTIPTPDTYPKPHTLEIAQDVPWTSSHKYVARDMAVSGAKNTVHHATYNRPRLVAKLAGYNGRILAVMIPRKAGEIPGAEPVVESLPAIKGSLAARIVRGSWEDTIIFAYGHSLLEANGVRARGRWAVVRRDLATRRLLAHEICEGDWMEVDGKAVTI